MADHGVQHGTMAFPSLILQLVKLWSLDIEQSFTVQILTKHCGTNGRPHARLPTMTDE